MYTSTSRNGSGIRLMKERVRTRVDSRIRTCDKVPERLRSVYIHVCVCVNEYIRGLSIFLRVSSTTILRIQLVSLPLD